ncbi:MAG: hypothetical protein ACRDIU_03090, partial [Actinomycetota bacterium]
ITTASSSPNRRERRLAGSFTANAANRAQVRACCTLKPGPAQTRRSVTGRFHGLAAWETFMQSKRR